MVKISESRFDELEHSITEMVYKPGYNYDDWYPTAEEVRENLKPYNLPAVRFILWLTFPGAILSKSKRQECGQIKKILYDPDVLTIVPDEEFTAEGEN